jgi:acyl-CoA thioesterase
VAESTAASTGAFDRDTAVRRFDDSPEAERTGELVFSAEISPAWHGARGPHGGYLAAILLRALTEAAADQTRPVRSLTIHYARAPQPGPVRIRTTLERRGRSLSTLSARMEQDGKVIALALAAFSTPWQAPETAELPMPTVPAPDRARATTEALSERIEQGLMPAFLRHLVLQPRIGALPFSGSEVPMEGAMWLGLSDPQRPLDAIALALLSDVGIPPPFMRLREPASASTIDLTVHFRSPLPAAEQRDPAELCLGRLCTRVIHEGFFESDGVIWAADGTVLSHARQLAILMPSAGG